MRRNLRWALGLTVLASAVAVSVRPNRAEHVAAVVPKPTASRNDSARTREQGRTPKPLPPLLARELLQRAKGNPFAELPVNVAPVVAVPAVSAPPAPPPVAVPPPDYRFVGRVVGPDEVERVYIGRRGRDIEILPGTALDDGYVVEGMDHETIRLHHPASDTRAEIAIPQAPAESRVQ